MALKVLICFSALVALAYGGVVSAPLPYVAPYASSVSAHVTHHSFAAPYVAAPPVVAAAPLVASPPVVASPLVASPLPARLVAPRVLSPIASPLIL